MADAGVIAGAAGQGLQAIPALVGRGKVNRSATEAEIDSNVGEYGGKPGGLDERRQQLQGQQNTFNQQQGTLFNSGMGSLGQANQARGEQTQALALARARATGQAPSIAQMQADRQMQQATAAQASAAASARGPAALALAQQNAAANTANAQANISGQAQVAAAQERLAAENAYAAQAAGLRGADVGQASTAFGAGAQSGQLGATYAGLENQAIGQAGQQRLTLAQIKAQAHGQAEGQNMAAAAQNAGSEGLIDTIGDKLGDIGPAAGLMLLSDVNAKGPVSLGRGGGMLSDFTGKLGPVQLGGASAINGMNGVGGGSSAVATPTFDKLTAGGGGMDVMGSLEAHSAVGTQNISDPTGGMSGGMMLSDFVGKEPTGVVPLTETPGTERHWDQDVVGGARQEPTGASLSGPTPRYSSGEPAPAPKAKGGAGGEKPKREMTPQELADWADAETEKTKMQQERALAAGPAVSADGKPPMWLRAEMGDRGESNIDYAKTPGGQTWAQAPEQADKPKSDAEVEKQPGWLSALSSFNQAEAQRQAAAAQPTGYQRFMLSDERAKDSPALQRPSRSPMAEANRSFVATPYAYKPGLGPDEQAPGEVNVGPMAQNLASNPVASTAVKRDDETGLLAIDRDKALKLALGGIADLQRQQDETRLELAKGGGRKLPGPQRKLPGPQKRLPGPQGE